MPTVAELIISHAEEPRPALLFEDETWSYQQLAGEASTRAALLNARPAAGPPHIGVLLDNVPEFVFWLSAAALTRCTVVGINPTRRGTELQHDIQATDCQWIVTDEAHLDLLAGLDLGVDPARTFIVDTERYRGQLADHDGAAMPDAGAQPDDLFMLIFTSGTTGTPKAVRCSQGRLARSGAALSGRFLGSEDVVYQAMPMFHSNAVLAGWSPALNAGVPMAMRRRFSASGWLPDVRRYGVTYFNYVGKPLAYILATPQRPDDADNPVRIGFGNEANPQDIDAFARRFGCQVIDAYGSSEGGAAISRTPDTPSNALGRQSDDLRILDPETGQECPPARFDATGRLLNAAEAIGEIASRSGPAMFEGYYNNKEADTERVHDGIYWTGDLAYRDQQGFVYFAGRGHDWLRVDGENFAAAPIEGILGRHPDVMLAAVYAVPDAQVGDQVMAAVQLRPDAANELGELDAYLRAQPDLGTKWLPRFVRVSSQLPTTATAKILKQSLRAERWQCDDPVWWRPQPADPLRRLTADDCEELRQQFDRHGRLHVLELP